MFFLNNKMVLNLTNWSLLFKVGSFFYCWILMILYISKQGELSRHSRKLVREKIPKTLAILTQDKRKRRKKNEKRNWRKIERFWKITNKIFNENCMDVFEKLEQIWTNFFLLDQKLDQIFFVAGNIIFFVGGPDQEHQDEKMKSILSKVSLRGFMKYCEKYFCIVSKTNRKKTLKKPRKKVCFHWKKHK